MLGKASQKFALSALCMPALWAMVLLTLITLPSHAQPFQSVPDRVESLTLPARVGDDASPFKPRRAGASPPPRSISIGPVSREKIAADAGAAPRPGTPRKIGFGRDIAELGSSADTAARLPWQDTPQGGKIAALSITSPRATGVRLGVLVRRLPAEATLRFYPQGAGDAYEFSGGEVMESLQRNLDAGDKSDEARTFWSPYVEGEEATLEIELPPGISPGTLEIAIPRISHFFSSPLAAQGGNIEKIGQAASCEIDVSCSSGWSNESNATAGMIFVDSGSSYECSGTLLNNRASNFTPYFLSANHCISSQTVASTLETYWFFRSTACNSGVLNPGYQRRTGGATLLYASSVTDTSFMQLFGTLPSGVSYAGWLTSAPSLGTPVTGIHHPEADLQKISFGSLQSYQDCTNTIPILGFFNCSAASQADGEFLNVIYTTGTTEGGSSGSGLFATIGSSHYLIGQLRGGDASCSNPSGDNEYGRFDLAYNAALSQWLDAGLKPVYRFVDTKGGGHFYTIYESEKNAVIQNYNWFRYEGIGFYAAPVAQPGTLPVYRFFNMNTGGHFYTINEAEKNTVIQNYSWFQYEGIGFYASPVQQPGSLPVHRFADTKAGGHFYTIYESEKNAVIQDYPWFRYEGIGFHAYPPQ